MSQDWMPGAERVAGAQSGGDLVGGPAKATHHITTGGSVDFLKGYLVQKGFEPTLLADPVSGRIAQFLSASRSGYAMKHPAGSPNTNRQGSRHIQIEWCWDSMDHLTITSAAKWPQVWGKVLAFCRANGVPDAVPFGSFMSSSRDPQLWGKGGHAGHRNAPGNDHSDSLPVQSVGGLFVPAHSAQAAVVRRTKAGDRWLGLANPPMTGPEVVGVRHALHLCDPTFPEGDTYDQHCADTVAVFQAHRGINERGVGDFTWPALRAVPGVHG
jgi:hypothetical protein